MDYDLAPETPDTASEPADLLRCRPPASDPPAPRRTGPRARVPARTMALGALAALAALAALGLSACGQAATSSGGPAATAPAPSTVNSRPVISSIPRSPTATPSARASVTRSARPGSSLPYSTASPHTVQRQPAPGHCHAIGSGVYSRPDPHCTPGALNPAVTPVTLDGTICHSGWTRTVRPPESVTEAEKAGSTTAYGDSGPMSAYEYDHFVPLELGGAVNDARNLWPEPGATPNPKDAVEDELRKKVCDGQMTLAQAQRAIVTNWIALARSPSADAPSQTPGARSTTAPSATAAQCSLTASYNNRHHDYDVYVRSNQPDHTVTVTDASGTSASWHTDASGYADVYFHAPATAAGETVTADVGGATCRTAL